MSLANPDPAKTFDVDEVKTTMKPSIVEDLKRIGSAQAGCLTTENGEVWHPASLLLPAAQEIQEQARIIQELEQRIRDLEAQLKEYSGWASDQFLRYQEEHRKLQQHHLEVDADRAGLKQRILEIETERDRFQKQVNELKRGIKGSDFELAFLDAYVDQFKTLRARVETMEGENQILHRMLRYISSTLAGEEHADPQLAAELADQRIRELEAAYAIDVAPLEQRICELEAEHDQLKALGVSGCCCRIKDDDEIVEWCALHARERDRLKADVNTILEAFDKQIFIRDVSRDSDAGWAIKLLPYISAMGRLKEQLNKR